MKDKLNELNKGKTRLRSWFKCTIFAGQCQGGFVIDSVPKLVGDLWELVH